MGAGVSVSRPLKATGVFRLKLILSVATALLFAASIGASVIIFKRQDALRQASRYNLAWLTSQATVEVTRLDAAIGASAIPGSDANVDTIQLRLDIVANRVQLLRRGEAADLIAGRPQLEATVRNLAAAVAGAQPMLDALAAGDPKARGALLKLIDPLPGQLTQLAAAANIRGGDLVSRDQRQLNRLQMLFAAITFGLTLCSFGLVSVLAWQYRLLRQSHSKVELLVGNLRDAGERLIAANQNVETAMAEVQLQNRILHERDQTLVRQNARFDAALNNMSQALCMVGADETLIVCNTQFLDLFGIPATKICPGIGITELFLSAACGGRFDRMLLEAIFACERKLAARGGRDSFFQQDASGSALAVSHQPMVGGGWVATYEDITERRRVEARIERLAHYDTLTGLPNRVLFRDRMNDVLRSTGVAAHIAVLCLDLDHFKNVNDALGHPAGDDLLVRVAERITGCIGETDAVARFGGDEFAILQISPTQPESAQALAQRIVDVINAPCEINGAQVVVGVSIGIATPEHGGGNADLLLKNADLALYRAKAEGRNTHCLFETEMDTLVQIRRTLEADLREAIASEQLQVFYQPQLDLRTNRVTGFEALIRWRHPTHGMVSPAQFIPIAEETGLIMAIGEWVLRRACIDAAGWPAHVKVAVNLSPLQFRDKDLFACIAAALRDSGLAPDRLEMEITESALLRESDKVLAVLHALRDLGIRIALDDFGTGYSSLSYLRAFPFDKLKIDQSFIQEMGTRPDCLAIVSSITELARTLGMTTTAEGVETNAQLDQLREAGCTHVQGYLLARPKPVSEIARWWEDADAAV